MVDVVQSLKANLHPMGVLPILNLSSATPLYAQLLEHFHQLIHSGQLQPGDRFPAEMDLAKEYGVARITVRRAIEELVHEGLLVRRQGKGSFVAATKIERELINVRSFSAHIQARGMQPGARVVSVQTHPATARLAETLGVAVGSPVVAIQRVRYANGEPTAVETSFVSLDRCPGIDQVDFNQNSLYRVLEETYHMKPANSRSTLEMTPATAHEAKLLGIAPGAPLFLMKATVSVADGTVAEHAKNLCRADRFRFQI